MPAPSLPDPASRPDSSDHAAPTESASTLPPRPEPPLGPESRALQPGDEDRVGELLSRWRELRGQGQEVSAEELCGDRPDLLDRVRHDLRAVQAMEAFLDTRTRETLPPAAPPDVAVWHSVEAGACEQEGDWVTASWHLDHWLAGLPAPCPQLLARRGRLALELGREKEAARDYAAAVRLGRTDADTLGWSARLSLAVGDREGYQQTRATLLKQFDPQRAAGAPLAAARTAVLAPAAGAHLDPLLEELPDGVPDPASQTARGGLLLRRGRLAEAVAELQRASAQRSAGEAPVADLLLALAQHKLGQTAAARRTLERARFLLDAEAPVQQAAGLLGGGTAGPLSTTVAAAQPSPRPAWDLATRLEVRILRREAEGALGEHQR
jgi:tetratricopeptide (TPR) repeat protein